MINAPHFLAERLARLLFDYEDTLPDPDKNTLREAVRALRQLPVGSWEVKPVIIHTDRRIDSEETESCTNYPEEVREFHRRLGARVHEIGGVKWENGEPAWSVKPSRSWYAFLKVLAPAENCCKSVTKSSNELEGKVDNSDTEK